MMTRNLLGLCSSLFSVLQELVAQQDIVLDDMHSALARLGDVAVTISDELEVQNAYVVLHG